MIVRLLLGGDLVSFTDILVSNWVSHKRGHCPWTILSTISEDYRHAVERHKLFLIESDVASDASSKEGRKR